VSTSNTLSAIIQAIKDELSYDPKAKAYYNSLARRIQRAYEEVLDCEPWLFSQKTASVPVLKTITGSASQRVSATLSINQRRVQAIGGYTFPIPVLGALFVDQSGTEHRIIGREPNVIFLNSSLTQDIGSFTDSTNWSIRFDRVVLPADCKEVMGIMDRNSDGLGRIIYVTRRQEEMAWMDKDDTSQPQFYIEDDMLTVSPPTVGPKVTATTGGSLPPRTFEYCYTIFYAGRESAPSPPARVTTTATNNRVQVTALEDVRYVDGTGAFFESGILRRVYRRDVTNDGAWVLIEAVGSNVTSSPFLNDDKLLPLYAGDREGLIHLNIPSVYQTIRPWQTPDTDRTWTVRYRYEPPPLVADNATSILPRPYHSLLTYRVLADLLSGGESAKFERRYLELLQKCRDSYLDRTEASYPTQSWMREIVGDDRRGAYDRNLSLPSLS
jgi:hypothetical protein